MIEVLTLLKDEFQTNPDLVTLVGSECYAIAAPQQTGKVFVVYTVSEEPPLTKDGVGGYAVRILLSSEDVDDLIVIMTTSKTAMDSLTVDSDYQGSSEIDQSADQHFTINLNYQLTL